MDRKLHPELLVSALMHAGEHELKAEVSGPSQRWNSQTWKRAPIQETTGRIQYPNDFFLETDSQIKVDLPLCLDLKLI